ncbi:DUF4276 family protein [Streptomyces sp. NPDC007088]|uniref:DUF4276 family protein n=1 Tax=Streptomyces sp. NPDC007088 TaxID=3364773 RepID=UPI0036C6CE50
MLEILLEEPSAEILVQKLAPVVVPSAQEGVNFATRVFQGKHDMLRKLPQRLAGYGSWAAEGDCRCLILLDRDDDDCMELKTRLVGIVNSVKGLEYLEGAKAVSGGHVKVRIACEEIEAWMFGDPEALRAAYPKLPRAFEKKSIYREPDEIKGGTWERMERLLQGSGYFPGGLRKMELARTVAPYMNPKNNNSTSFLHFCQALQGLI